MSEKILVPALGESITEATEAKWLKNVGDNIELAKIDDLNSSDAIVVWAEDLKEKIPVLYLRIRQAVKNGVKAAVILNGKLPHAVLLEMFTERGVGTLITN